jgi:hypothetical protein
VGGLATWLFCAWLAWSRFRVVLPMRDKTLPTVVACIDVTLRRFGGCPTYAQLCHRREDRQESGGVPRRR